jgi:hypothetical protein
MKTKKTIRTKLKHRPLTRDLAKLQRDLHSLERRMDRIIEFAQEIEGEARVLTRENVGLRERLEPPEERPTTAASELSPELPNGEGTMTGDCEYLLRSRKPDREDVVKCSLTGNVCFCGVEPLMCTRRTFALDCEAKLKILDSQNRPQST